MTAQDRTTNKQRFENGDVPDGTQYADLIDSFVALVDSSAQTMQANLTVPTLIASEVSAATVNVSALSVSGSIAASAASLAVSAATVGSLTVSGTAAFQGAISVSGAATMGAVSANTLAVASALSVAGALVTASATASGGTVTVPGTAVGYLVVSVSGVNRAIPFYTVA